MVDGVGEAIYQPVMGIYEDGISGGAVGVVQGLVKGLITQPISGGSTLINKVAAGFRASSSPELPALPRRRSTSSSNDRGINNSAANVLLKRSQLRLLEDHPIREEETNGSGRKYEQKGNLSMDETLKTIVARPLDLDYLDQSLRDLSVSKSLSIDGEKSSKDGSIALESINPHLTLSDKEVSDSDQATIVVPSQLVDRGDCNQDDNVIESVPASLDNVDPNNGMTGTHTSDPREVEIGEDSNPVDVMTDRRQVRDPFDDILSRSLMIAESPLKDSMKVARASSIDASSNGDSKEQHQILTITKPDDPDLSPVTRIGYALDNKIHTETDDMKLKSNPINDVSDTNAAVDSNLSTEEESHVTGDGAVWESRLKSIDKAIHTANQIRQLMKDITNSNNR